MRVFSILFSFKGKIGRLPYWFSMIGVFFAIGFLAESKLKGVWLLALIPFFAIQIKRCRDIGWSGWLSLFSYIPIAQWIWWIALGVKKGKQEENCFYSEPAEESSQEHENSDFKQEEQKKENEGFQGNYNERIITCPSCGQKIKIRLPIPGNVGRCITCSTRFELRMDESGHIYITKIDSNTGPYGNEYTINDVTDCFELLEINRNSTSAEIKAAYRKKMMEYHPDKVEKLGSKLKIIAEGESKKLNTAYSILKKQGYV